MQHKWVLMDRDGKHVPVKLSDCLTDKSYTLPGKEEVRYDWKKVEHSDATIDYVCFYKGKQIGYIPLDWADGDLEMASFWANRRNQTLSDIQIEIMDRHYHRIKDNPDERR